MIGDINTPIHREEVIFMVCPICGYSTTSDCVDSDTMENECFDSCRTHGHVDAIPSSEYEEEGAQ